LADAEPEAFQALPVQPGAEAGAFQTERVVTLLAGIAQPGEPQAEPGRAVAVERPSDRLRAADRDDADAVAREVAAAALGERLDRPLVAHPLDQDHSLPSHVRIISTMADAEKIEVEAAGRTVAVSNP